MGTRSSIVGSEELCPGVNLSRDGQLARLVGVIEQGGQVVVGCRCTKPVDWGFLVGESLAEACFHPERVAYGVELDAGIVEC